MQQHNLFGIFIDRLNLYQIRYVVTGSVAAIVYSEPRVTHDIDLVIECDITQAGLFEKAFPLEQFYCPPLETLLLEIKRRERGHFNIIHHETGFKADFYLVGGQGFLAWALENVKPIEFFDSTLNIAPIEYVIIKKLEYYREGQSQKHLRDIKKMLLISQEDIDFSKLKKFIAQYGLQEVYELAAKFEI